MPLYSFSCPSCGETEDVLRPVAQRNDPVICKKCCHPAVRIEFPGCGFTIDDAPLLRE